MFIDGIFGMLIQIHTLSHTKHRHSAFCVNAIESQDDLPEAMGN